MALLQVRACYRPRACLDWLGLPLELAGRSRLIRNRLEQRHDGSIAEQVAAALLDLGPMYRAGVDPEALVEAKCRAHALVLVMGRGRREAYWQGERLDVDWSVYQAPWDLLTTLAERVRSVQGIDAFDLEGNQ